MLCTLSAQICEEPVVTRNGDIYERRLIEKHIETTGTDPITKEGLRKDDLIAIKGASAKPQPRSTQTTSLPGLLSKLQAEWDATMLEMFGLKQQLEATRQELAHTLYQHEAACRVIARVVEERDAARKELVNAQANRSTGDAMEVDEAANAFPGISEDLNRRIAEKAKELTKRRKVQTPEGQVSAEDIAKYKLLSSKPTHKASSPGILCVDVHPNKPQLILTGGVDKTTVVFDRVAGKKLATLSGHTKPVTSVMFHPNEDIIASTSLDGTVRLYESNPSGRNPYKLKCKFALHSSGIVKGCLHPLGEHIITVSRDQSWAIHDIIAEKTLVHAKPAIKGAFTACRIHPDGVIVGTGTEENLIRIYTVGTQKNIATLEGHNAPVTDIAFSENGYYMATAGQDNVIKLWDLRRQKNLNIHTINLDSSVSALDYDCTGKHLAAAIGSEIRVFAGKTLQHVVTWDEHSGDVTDVKFGSDGKFLASTSMDRTVKFWGQK